MVGSNWIRENKLVALLWLLSSIGIGVATPYITTHFEWQNQLAMLQVHDQQSRIGSFRETGRDLYVAVAIYNDALGTPNEAQAKQGLTIGIAKHAAALRECQDLFAKSQTEQYGDNLAEVMSPNGPQRGMEILNSILSLSKKRDQMVGSISL